MRIEIPIKELIQKLALNKFIKFDRLGLPNPTARKDLVNFTHHEILSFYNHRIQGLLAFYSFACNLTSLRKIIMFLHLSCALTLTLKFKLRTKRQIFKKFGRTLTDVDTGISLKVPNTLRVRHSYAGSGHSCSLDNLLKAS